MGIMADTHLSFRISRSQILDSILIPKYYDPEINSAVELASEAGYDLPELGEILLPGNQGSRLGSWIPRENYGSGDIPFVRTSDLSNWRVRADYKKGVSEAVYREYQPKQDVRALDLLMVAHGTYLVGAVAIVAPEEEKLVLQDHVFRLRVNPVSGVDQWILLACLSTGLVHRQVRARQFSADIIDKLGERHLQIRIPIPRDKKKLAMMRAEVQAIVEEQTRMRAAVREAAESDLKMMPERASARYGFVVRRWQIRNRVLIPKYYDPELDKDLRENEAKDPDAWIPLRSLVERGILSADTGVEVGKMAYGTGQIPFIRTSDIADWEVKSDVKQGVSESIYGMYKRKASLEPGDVLLVRDGTYLVGSSAIVGPDDAPALFCGGLYRLRVLDKAELNSNTLLAFLNLPVVRRQMRARQFTRDVIDTLGPRLLEVRIPSPFSDRARKLGERVGQVMRSKADIKARISRLVSSIEPPSPPEAKGRPAWSMR
jgi:hypothetical protein